LFNSPAVDLASGAARIMWADEKNLQMRMKKQPKVS